MNPTLQAFLKKLEVPEDKQHVKITSTQNPDLVPIPPERRTWTFAIFTSYWFLNKMTLSTFTSAATLLAYGLSIPHTMGAVIVANFITLVHTILNGQPGGDHHISFTSYSRAFFGPKGFYLAILLRSATAVVWYANQSFLGGTIINTIISCWSRHYMNWANTLPDNIPFSSKDIIGFILFQIIILPLVLMKPHKMRYTMATTAMASFLAMIGVCAYAVHENGGYGELMKSSSSVKGSKFSWMFLRAISHWYGSATAGVINKPDFTRFGTGRYTPYLGSVLGIMVMGTVIPVLGVITASALQSHYNESLWSPSDILDKWLEVYYTPAARAGVFFASVAFLSMTLVYCTILNCWSFGMDISGCLPRYVDIKRGSLIAMLLAWVIQPWKMYNTASNFATVMTAFSVFMCPLIAILICDYWILRRRRVKLTDFYTSSPDGVYYSYKGYNLKGLFAFTVGMAPGLPGLAESATPTIDLHNQGIVNFYYGDAIFGWAISFFVYWGLNIIWPPKDAGVMDPADYYGTYSDADCKDWGVIPRSQIPKEELAKYVNVEEISSDIDASTIEMTDCNAKNDVQVSVAEMSDAKSSV